MLDRTRRKLRAGAVAWAGSTPAPTTRPCPPPEPSSPRPSDHRKTVSEIEGSADGHAKLHWREEAAVQTGKISGNRTHKSPAPQCTLDKRTGVRAGTRAPWKSTGCADLLRLYPTLTAVEGPPSPRQQPRRFTWIATRDGEHAAPTDGLVWKKSDEE